MTALFDFALPAAVGCLCLGAIMLLVSLATEAAGRAIRSVLGWKPAVHDEKSIKYAADFFAEHECRFWIEQQKQAGTLPSGEAVSAHVAAQKALARIAIETYIDVFRSPVTEPKTDRPKWRYA